MAILDATKYTLAGIASHLDPQGKVAQIAEVLTVPLGVTADIPWVEGNLTTGHQSTLRSSLPKGTVRQPNYGVPREVETAKPQVDTCMLLETYSEVDEFDMIVNGMSAEFRWQKDKAFLEGLNQTFARYLFYSNSGNTIVHTAGIGSTVYTVSPLNFNGLVSRYSDLTACIPADNTVVCTNSAAASGNDQNSIWLIGWAPGKIYGIYPKGSKAGLDMEDLGKQTITDHTSATATDATYLHEAYRTHFKWYCGIVVEDWRYAVRICNIDTSGIATATLSTSMNEALDLIPDLTACNPVFYMNRFIKTTLRNEAAAKTNIWYKPSEFGGVPVEMYQTVPIHRCDMLGSTETILT